MTKRCSYERFAARYYGGLYSYARYFGGSVYSDG